MVQPKLISVIPKFGDYAGGESIIIGGQDIDAAATVEFIPYSEQTALPAAITQYVSFPNGIQHITVTTPAITVYNQNIDRPVTIRVTNPSGEFDELRKGWHARRLPSIPSFVERGTTLFYPEKLQTPWDGDPYGPYLFETWTLNTTIWKYTYDFTTDALGVVVYKAMLPAKKAQISTQKFQRNVGSYPEMTTTRHQGYMGPFITRGVIQRVVLEVPLGGAVGATVEWEDDAGLDAFQGGGTMPGVGGTATEFIPLLTGEHITVNDWMTLQVSNAPANSRGYVHVYLSALP